VESELGVLVDVVLSRILHELSADRLDFLGKGGREHHNLLLLRSSTENVLHISAHVRLVEHLVTLVEDKDANAAKSQSLVTDKSLETTRSTDNDMRASFLVLERLHVGLDGSTTIEDTGLDVGHVLAETVVLVADLVGQLTSVAHDNHRDLSVHGLNLLKGSKNEDSSLTQTGLGLADNVTTEECLGDTGLLDCRSNRC
jgi:hypothetical protein